MKISALAYMMRHDDRTIDKRGRAIKNVDFLKELNKVDGYAKYQSTQLSDTISNGIKGLRKAEKFAEVFNEYFDIKVNPTELVGFKNFVEEK